MKVFQSDIFCFFNRFFVEIEPIFVDLDYNANSRMLFDVFEDERHELEAIEEEYEDPSDSDIARQGQREGNSTEINERKRTEKRFIELPNLVPQIKGQYRKVSFEKLHFDVFEINIAFLVK